MKQVRHTVEKIRPEIPYTFDQQFWPVLIAICVVVSMGAGAIVTLIEGPWMWASLLALPAAAAFSIFLLYRLDDSVLRRSLQIAILASLAIHLLVVVAASLTSIFGTEVPAQQTVVARQPQKKIVISNRTKQLVFEETHKHETPDTEIQQEKTQTATRSQAQPVPVKEPSETASHQIAQRREFQPSVPRLEQQLSQQRRSSHDTKPVSSSGSAVASTSSSTGNSVPKKSANPSETEISRNDSQSPAKIEKQSATDPARSDRERVESASQRRESAPSATASSSRATARIRRNEPGIPEIANSISQPDSQREPVKPTQADSRQLEMARTETAAASVQKQPVTAAEAPKLAVQKSMMRRQPVPEETKLNPELVKNESVRSNSVNSPVAKLESQSSPSATATQAPSRTVEPKSLALTRSVAGMSGSGRSKNLDRVQGGQPSPVNIASDSSNRRQSNRMSDNISLSSLQQSQRASRGRETDSQRILKAETAKWARRSGSANPSDKSLHAAAANVDSSIAQSRDQQAAEKGTSMLDLGPSKIVPETTADRRSGGGMPDLSDAVAQNDQRPSGRQSNPAPHVELTGGSVPSMDVETPQVAAAQNPGADQWVRDSAATEAEANKKTGRAEPAETSNDLSREVAEATGRTPRRAESDSRATDFPSEPVTDEDERRQGNERTRLAQSPSVSRNIDSGFTGEGKSKTVDAADSKLEAASSEIARTDAEWLSAGGMLGATAQVAATSVAGLPLFPNGTGKRRRRESADANASDGQSFVSPSRDSESLQPNINSSLVGKMSTRQPASAGELTANESDGAGSMERQSTQSSLEAGAAMELDAPEGPVGFADIASRRVGKSVEASADSDFLSPNSDNRFKRQDFGGAPAVTLNAPLAKQAFRKRDPAALAESGPSTEAAIEAGLAFLARHQLADGSWTLGQFDNNDPLFQSQLNSDTAATGLALLAFQGAGYSHREYKYANQLKAAINWLIANQAESGGLYVESDTASNESSRLYSHAIAALALTEAYGMTQDPGIRDATQRALDYIADTQDSKRGGWRYFAEPSKRSSDTSVTGWMLMALHSGRLAGLETNPSTLEQIEAWLRVAQVPDTPSEFRYNPYAVDSAGKSRMHGRQASVTMTSVGLLMRVYSGWGPGDPQFLSGAEVLLQQLPSDRNSRLRDTYYWYYATQVMKHAGGEYWEQWNRALHPLLLDTQEKQGDMAGSWHPYKPVPDRWGPQGGRIYVTTMNLLSLEVRYRLLPLYENTIR